MLMYNSFKQCENFHEKSDQRVYYLNNASENSQEVKWYSRSALSAYQIAK